MFKILCFGFGTTPIFFKALFNHSAKNEENITWSVVLPTSHHLKLMRELLPAEDIVCIQEQLPSLMKDALDLSIAKNYPGNLCRDIETKKITLKHRASARQIKTALATYIALKRFVLERKPDYVLYAQPPEGMDGMILAGVARELGVKLAVPHHTRNIGRSFFSHSEQEVLPEGYSQLSGAEEWANKFLSNFREEHIQPAPRAIISEDEVISHKIPSRLERTIGFARRFFTEAENREIGILRVSLLNSWFPVYRDIYRGTRRYVNQFNYNCDKLEELPEKIIFYPLQYTPESSINVPAPYFVDQTRIIDAIRMVMPNDYQLVVKEHPACIFVRDGGFTKDLLRKAGVIVANYKINTQDIIKRSALTISVTGTAAFEAFLYGRASIVMGPTFFSKYLGGICGIDELPERIRKSVNMPITDEDILKALQQIYSLSADFVGRAPGERGNAMMGRNNLNTFWKQFKLHSSEARLNERR